MDDTKIVYGIRFPLPATIRKRTKENHDEQIRKELCDIIEKMNKATTCSIKLDNLSIEAQQILCNLGYKIIADKGFYGVIPSFKIEWYDDKEKEEK